MKLKKELLILVLVIVVLAGYLMLRGRESSRLELPQPSQLESKKIDRIVITTSEAVIELVKKDEKWSLQPQGFPADPTQVTNMLNAIADLKLTALVSESGNYERYNLDDANKIVVQAFSGSEEMRKFNVGQVAPTFRHTFVKLTDDPNVYHAQGSFKNNFDQTVESLRDKIVLTFDKSAITAIEIQRGEQAVKITKNAIEPTEAEKDAEATKKSEPQWQIEGGDTVDQAELERFMTSMSRLQCEGFLNEKTKEDFQSPRWIVAFKGTDNTYTFSLFEKYNEDDYTYPALSSTSPYVFTLPKSRIETFEKQLDTLMQIKAKE